MNCTMRNGFMRPVGGRATHAHAPVLMNSLPKGNPYQISQYHTKAFIQVLVRRCEHANVLLVDINF